MLSRRVCIFVAIVLPEPILQENEFSVRLELRVKNVREMYTTTDRIVCGSQIKEFASVRVNTVRLGDICNMLNPVCKVTSCKFSAWLVFWEWSPSMTCGFPSSRTNNGELWCFCCGPEHIVEQTVYLTVIIISIFFISNLKIYRQSKSCLYTHMTEVAEILPRVRQ